MSQPTDAELLRRYADEKSEAAFGELVRRQVNLVYSVALRQCGGNAPLAEDVTQRVFTDLARKAPSLSGYAVLGGWLYRRAQFVASDVVRAEHRRRAREQEAQAMQEISRPIVGDAEWQKLAPVLDQVVGELPERDRDAVVLRFMEGRPFADIGATLRLTEDAARMRVERALEKLRTALARQGITSTSAALGVALANQAGVAAPAGLAASVTGAVLAGGGTAAGGGAVATLLTFMSTGKMAVGLAGIAAAVALGTAFTLVGRRNEAEVKSSAAASRQATLDARVADLTKRIEAGAQRVEGAEVENARLLRAAAGQGTTNAAAPKEEEPVTSDVVQERMNQARELVRKGDYPKALQEIVWLFDVGTKWISLRRSSAVSLFAELAGKYSPARVALDERQEVARQKVMGDTVDLDALSDYGAIARELKDGAGVIALLEQFPAADRRRGELARSALDDLVESRRYALALEGRNFTSMVSSFEVTSRDRPDPLQMEDSRRWLRERVIKNAVRDVEVLAGVGEVANARAMAERLLAFDNSENTRAVLQEHLVRAGQPNLMSPSNR